MAEHCAGRAIQDCCALPRERGLSLVPNEVNARELRLQVQGAKLDAPPDHARRQSGVEELRAGDIALLPARERRHHGLGFS
jgi:hypothetical protein